MVLETLFLTVFYYLVSVSLLKLLLGKIFEE